MTAGAITIGFDVAHLTLDRARQFSVRFSRPVSDADVYLVVDIYDLANPVHPDGHVGWWQYPVETLGESVEIALHATQQQRAPIIDGLEPIGAWVNPEDIRPRSLLINAVLRSRTTNGIVALARLPAFRSNEELQAYRALLPHDWTTPRFATGNFLPRRDRVVRLVAQSLVPRDAVGNFCFDIYRLLRQNGFAAELYASDFPLELNDVVKSTANLVADIRPTDFLLYFHSTNDPVLDRLGELDCERRIAYFHGVTDPRLVQVFDPELAQALQKGHDQIALLADFDVVATNSRANADRLIEHFPRDPRRRVEDIDIVPPKLIAAENLPAGSQSGRKNALLYVGRIKSHKRIEHLLQLFAEYLKLDPEAECWIAGSASDKAYPDYLHWVERQQLALPEGSVKWLGSVSPQELDALYGSAQAYVSMSEDEGFCLPILEAMQNGLPVFAYGLPAVIEVMSGAGQYFDQKDYEAIAHAIHTLAGDPVRLGEVLRRQHEVATKWHAAMDGLAVLDWLSPARVKPATAAPRRPRP